MNGDVAVQTGLLVVDKSPGWTSHDVVARCRHRFGQRRVGHAGTLDPGATGLLLVGLGRFTRLLRFLTALPKTYTFEIVLGVATDSLDDSGVVVERWKMGPVALDDACQAAAGLTGVIEQVPPMVSAVKIDGQRLHHLARQGIEVERPPRSVEVHRFDVGLSAEEGVLQAEVECSSGTYVRVLAADLGRRLGGGAHLRKLRRTAVGSFGEDDACPVELIDEARVLAPAEALRDIDKVTVGRDLEQSVTRGLPLDRVPLGASGSGPWALLGEGGRLLAVYEATESDRIRPAVVVASEPAGRSAPSASG